MALSQWWQPNHTNWDLLEWDSEVFKTSGQLVLATMAETDSQGQCHSSKHGSPCIQSSMNKHSAGGAVTPSPFYPIARESADRGMRHLAGSKDGIPSQFMTMQHSQRSHKVSAGPRGNAFPQSSSWEWPSSSHTGARQAIASSTEIPSAAHDRSGLVMEMQTAFEENSGLAHCGQVALDSTSAAASIVGANGVFTTPIRSENLADPMAVSVANATQAGAQDFNGGATRLLSGMSVEGLVHDHTSNILMSRNTSGLDTMQSIEQALPDGECTHPAMNV
nr:hypothetical protein [Ulva partita]